jgi:hypothetical protein
MKKKQIKKMLRELDNQCLDAIIRYSTGEITYDKALVLRRNIYAMRGEVGYGFSDMP